MATFTQPLYCCVYEKDELEPFIAADAGAIITALNGMNGGHLLEMKIINGVIYIDWTDNTDFLLNLRCYPQMEIEGLTAEAIH